MRIYGKKGKSIVKDTWDWHVRFGLFEFFTSSHPLFISVEIQDDGKIYLNVISSQILP